MSDGLQIAIVTRNRPEHIRDTIRRLDSLKLSSSVFVVDGSDNSKTEQICGEFGIDYYRQESNGRISARNDAIRFSDSEYLAFIDDDVIVRDSWYETLVNELRKPGVVGATGKLVNEYPDRPFPENILRNYLFGSESQPGYVSSDGSIGGRFDLDHRTTVDHLPGCNMAFTTEVLEELNGFDTDFERGNAYREETITSYLAGSKGKLIYNPDAALEHLKAEENRNLKSDLYTIPYNTRLFLHKTELINGPMAHIKHLFNNILLNVAYLLKYRRRYPYYLYGELDSVVDVHLLNKYLK